MRILSQPKSLTSWMNLGQNVIKSLRLTSCSQTKYSMHPSDRVASQLNGVPLRCAERPGSLLLAFLRLLDVRLFFISLHFSSRPSSRNRQVSTRRGLLAYCLRYIYILPIHYGCIMRRFVTNEQNPSCSHCALRGRIITPSSQSKSFA